MAIQVSLQLASIAVHHRANGHRQEKCVGVPCWLCMLTAITWSQQQMSLAHTGTCSHIKANSQRAPHTHGSEKALGLSITILCCFRGCFSEGFCEMMKYWGVSVVLLLVGVVWGARAQQGLSEELVEEILNAHNYYRSLVDPIATNMLKLVRTPSSFTQ